MGFHYRFGPGDLLRCRFAVSPRWETQEAVRVLRDPQRQAYHLPWLRRVRAAAAGLDLRPLWLLMPTAGHHPDFLSPPPLGPSVTMAEELARVRAADPGAAREEVRRSLACTPGALESAAGRRMLADPARTVRELADLTERAWEALVAPDWPRLRALLEADVLFHSRRLAAGGLEALFDGLHPDLRWHGESSTLAIERRTHHDRSLGGRGLLLMPSAFGWPEVVGGYDPPWQPTVVYPARGIGALWAAAPEPTPRALARLLGPVRADVLCALHEPASTTALAHRLCLAPSTVSAHLRVLRAAGLLISARHGHQVLYERTPLAIALTTGEPPPTP
ncbi:ArsR/SmtB family transcription factor [Streptomyces subrutilus]|uniref:ArsR/SmtB family transcription factor n=1 Tax=Streptomyces subrutilus TaxID=36818 RepID=UPI0033C18A69